MNKVKDNKEINEDKTFLEDLETAIENVKIDYVEGLTIKALREINNEIIEDKYYQRLERVFAYELYHKWRIIMDGNCNYSNLMLNGEIYKKNFFNDENYFSKQIINPFCDTAESFIPDMVLHQRFDTFTGQKLSVEIKINNDLKKIWCDLMKLSFYVNRESNKGLNFDHGAMIIIQDQDDEKILNSIKQFYIANKEIRIDGSFGRIIIFLVNDSSIVPNHNCIVVKTLAQIINHEN